MKTVSSERSNATINDVKLYIDIDKKEGEINLLIKDKALQEVIIQKKNFTKNLSKKIKLFI